MLQNRVDPWGRLHAVANRGTLMGNRGILHDDTNQIIRPWAHKGWVTCALTYKTNKRDKPFSVGHYSELFFLDEATAFAAGHRPCATCRRPRFDLFKEAWCRANSCSTAPRGIAVADIDKALHLERATPGGGKQTYQAATSDLPVGVMVEWQGAPYLRALHGWLPWSFSGYGRPVQINFEAFVDVLTPRSVVNAFRAGFVPEVHASASG